MFNKLIVGTLSATLLIGGAFQTTADASANTDQSQGQSHQYKYYYSLNGNWSELSSDKFNRLFGDYFLQDNRKEDKKQQSNEQPKQEQPEQEKQEQPDEQTKAPTQQQTAEQQQQQSSQNQSQQLNEFEQQVVELTNEERTSRGLSPLKIDTELSKVAREKSRNMGEEDYFSHNSPTYGSPFDMMKDFGITYKTAGENIARGQQTPEKVVNAWMNSEGHRENILSPNFTHIGVGYVEQGSYWTQHFIGK